MTNPMGIVTNNPKAFIKSPSPVAGNMRLGVNNVAPIPNVANPKSIGSPSANGYSQVPINPKYTPYTGYEPLKAIENPTQAVQTTAKTPISLGAVLGVAGKVLAVVGFVQTVQDIGTELGNLSNAIDLPRRQSERERLDKLLKERERVAQAIDAARVDSSPPVNPPPFTGGQIPGVAYSVGWVFTIIASGETSSPINSSVIGPVGGISHLDDGTVKIGDQPVMGLQKTFYSNPRIVSVNRADGQPDTGGNPAPLIPNQAPTIPAPYPDASEWLYGSPLVTVSGNAAKMLDKMEAAAPNMPMMKGDPIKQPDNLQPLTPNPVIPENPNGLSGKPSPALPEFKKIPSSDTPLYNSGSQVAPNPPASKAPEKFSIPPIDPNAALIMGTIAAGTVTTTNLLNQINQQTTPQAQQNNVAEGMCNATQPNQCARTNIENAVTEATNPIKDIANANNGLLANALTLLNNLWTFLQNSLGKVLQLLNNQVVDRTLAVMNLATNIHNAAMLTRDIGETLGSVVDNVISLSPLRFTNSEGSQVQFTDFIGSNFRSFLISVLGAENYVSLVINWQKANTVYHATMGVINTTQSMIDPISSAVEYGMENVSKIGNSLKEDGVVSENAYPAMDETIRARRVNRFERLNDTLEGAENIASNLSSVTSSAVSIKEDYKQLREDAKDLKDKATAFNNADSEARAALKAELPTEITPITLAPAPAEDEAP